MAAIVYASPANCSIPLDVCGEAAASAAWPQALISEPAANTARELRPRLCTARPAAPRITGAMRRPKLGAVATR